MQTSHHEYPKMMQHPHARKGAATKLDPNLPDRKSDWQGTPDKFPPVLVHNEDQEEQYLAQGYWTLGTSSPEAFAASVASAPPEDYEPEQYPKWVKGLLAVDAEHEKEILERHAGESALESQADALDTEYDEAENEFERPGASRARGRPRKVV